MICRYRIVDLAGELVATLYARTAWQAADLYRQERQETQYDLLHELTFAPMIPEEHAVILLLNGTPYVVTEEDEERVLEETALAVARSRVSPDWTLSRE